MPLRLDEFFPGHAASTTLRPLLARAPPLSPAHSHILLTGPERSGKTTLLLHLAYSLAAQNASVLLLVSKERLQGNPPAVASGLPPSDPTWQKIGIKYLEDDVAVLRFGSLLHLSPNPPNVVLIDDIDNLLRPRDSPPSLLQALGEGQPTDSPCSGSIASGKSATFPRSRDAALCRLLAVLTDSLDHVQRMTGRMTLLAATATCLESREAPLHFPFLKRWLPCVLACRPVSVDADSMSQDVFRLSAVDDDGTKPVGWAADYSLDRGVHVLLGVVTPEVVQEGEVHAAAGGGGGGGG